MSAERHKLLLAPLHKTPQDISSRTFNTDLIPPYPNFQANQDNSDIQHAVHLENIGETLVISQEGQDMSKANIHQFKHLHHQ